jgi:hypothetical protein
VDPDRPGRGVSDGNRLLQDLVHAVIGRKFLTLLDADGGKQAAQIQDR